MAEKTGISWADATFNPWVGCTKVSPACDNCYAQNLVESRFKIAAWGAGQPRKRTSAANWRQPLKWNREAEATGVRKRVFCASLADVFDNEVDPTWRADLFALIGDTPYLDWLLLTKRIGNAAKMIELATENCDFHGDGTEFEVSPWFNVWLGITVCNQAEADRDIPKLLAVPAAKRFLSIEPMLGPIDLERPRPGPDLQQGSCMAICQPWLIQSGIDWVICGGESGKNARPLHPDHVRSLRDQCEAAGVVFHFKQWGEWLHKSQCLGFHWHGPVGREKEHAWPDGTVSYRIGTKAAGRELDGVIHDGVPQCASSVNGSTE